MRVLFRLVLLLAVLLLPGCFWGFFDGVVQVTNHTGRAIRVEAIVGQGGADAFFHDRIKDGDRETYGVTGGAFRPAVKISCNGRTKTIPFRLNFLGWAEVTVDREDFPPATNG